MPWQAYLLALVAAGAAVWPAGCRAPAKPRLPSTSHTVVSAPAPLPGARRAAIPNPLRAFADAFRPDVRTDFPIQRVIPRSGVDYKIQIVKPDPRIDYKMQYVGPHSTPPDESVPRPARPRAR